MMLEKNHPVIDKAIAVLKQGGVIAYPTEAVYGLGCDPFNEKAVVRLLQIKRRSISAGLILIAANWEQIAFLVQPLPGEIMMRIQATWPGPVTWLLPASAQAPTWIRGQHSSIALRITAHPLAEQLCRNYGQPIVSTSANHGGELPARDAAAVEQLFNAELDFIVPGLVGELAGPTEIRDALTGKIIRQTS